ncbi:MAG: Pycsar system effector family protein [Bacteroidota bacterium]
MDINQQQDSKSSILRHAEDYVLGLYNQHREIQLVFHNYTLAHRRVQLAGAFSQGFSLSAIQRDTIGLSCWFLHLGYLKEYSNPVQQSIRELSQFFKQVESSEELRKQVVQCIQTVGYLKQALNITEKIVADAHFVASYLPDFNSRFNLLQTEWEMNSQAEITETYLDTFRAETLKQLHFYTPEAKKRYEPIAGQVLTQQRAEERKRHKKNKKRLHSEPFQYLENGIPLRGAQTFFRTNYRNHINLSAIADNKANIMISLNAILISVLITFLSYRNIGVNQPKILLPVSLFLVTGLGSLIFAVLASRPKITRQPNGVKRNVIFFGNFVSLSLDDFELEIDQLLRDEQQLYGSMVRDLYFLGKVLDKKYRFLKVSYNIFMMGFIGTVLAFLAILLVIP